MESHGVIIEVEREISNIGFIKQSGTKPNLVAKILKITYLKLNWNLPGANELTNGFSAQWTSNVEKALLGYMFSWYACWGDHWCIYGMKNIRIIMCCSWTIKCLHSMSWSVFTGTHFHLSWHWWSNHSIQFHCSELTSMERLSMVICWTSGQIFQPVVPDVGGDCLKVVRATYTMSVQLPGYGGILFWLTHWLLGMSYWF